MLRDVSHWWAQVDSNHRPRAYQARALTTWAMSPWCFRCISFSLATLVEMMGIEPMTPCLQGRCSPSWATPPFNNEVLLNDFRSLKIEQQWKTILARCANFVSRRLFLVLVYFQTYDMTASPMPHISFSIERRWSSRTFRYGYLVTT